jgi:hypothetical protein
MSSKKKGVSLLVEIQLHTYPYRISPDLKHIQDRWQDQACSRALAINNAGKD